MYVLPIGAGGYFPFINLPCERFIGESLQFILYLSLSPLACTVVPWICCPFQIANTSYTISGDRDCNDIGALYGATAFWAMQVISVIGLVVAAANLANCAATMVGADVTQNFFQLTYPRPATFVIPNFEAPNPQGEKLQDKVNEINQYFVKPEMVEKLKEKYLLEKEKRRQEESINNATASEEVLLRVRRQVVDVRIPTLLGHVPGGDDQAVDVCSRDEVLVDEDGECHDLLSQGPCEDDHIVLMNPATRKGFCGRQLCAPDRVFLFSDQLCHHPRELGVCPPGRQLFTTSYGSPVCGCPDGTYEEDDDLDDDVCEPILGHISDCPPGEVFWFSDFRRPPECKPDPCKGLNLKRGPDDLPFVPALVDGKCYRIGTRPAICSSDEYYSLSLELLRGVCSSLEDAGYQILDSEDMDAVSKKFGDLAPKKHKGSVSKTSKPSKAKTPAGTTLLRRPEIGAAVVWVQESDDDPPPLSVGQPVMSSGKHHPADNEVERENLVALFPTHMNAFSPPMITVNGSLTFLGFTGGHHRQRRAPLPFATPGNVVEPGLSACRAGAKRDGNAKCRNTILPSRYPPSRPRRDVPPVPPSSSCPSGVFDLSRRCTSNRGGVASSINALGLG
nr:uncharacterized protein LOC128687193 isoform X1 [Cherax quadricarinatus]